MPARQPDIIAPKVVGRAGHSTIAPLLATQFVEIILRTSPAGDDVLGRAFVPDAKWSRSIQTANGAGETSILSRLE